MAKSIKGQQVNRTEVANLFGVALPTVDIWIRDGLPYVSKGGRGKQWLFDTAEVFEWRREKAVTDATGETQGDERETDKRMRRVNMEIKEIELAKAKAEIAPIDQVERMVARAFAEVRAGIRNLPGRLVTSLIGETDERRFKSVMLAEIDQVLESLANANLLESYSEAEEDDSEE